jgi:hypothetical protein
MVNSLVKSSFAIYINEEAMIICPVEETGRYSVTPSIKANIITSI